MWGLQHPGSAECPMCGAQSLGVGFEGDPGRCSTPKAIGAPYRPLPVFPAGCAAFPGGFGGIDPCTSGVFTLHPTGMAARQSPCVFVGHPGPTQLGVGSSHGSEQRGRGPVTLSLPQRGRDGGTGRAGGVCQPAALPPAVTWAQGAPAGLCPPPPRLPHACRGCHSPESEEREGETPATE